MMRLVVGSALACVAGLIGGRMLVAAIDRLVEPRGRGRAWAVAAPVFAAAAAALLWWWEAQVRGLGDGSEVADALLDARFAAHGVFFLFLAAASWVDLRHRVIPDAITVPGVLVGLAVVAVWPRVLLPVEREVPRSFAAALLEPDVLGLAGPLGGPWPTWLGAAPDAVGLVIAAAVFAVWWLVGTEPEVPPAAGRSWRARLASVRVIAAVAGVVIVAGGWAIGGDHWRGLVSALGGLAVAAGIIWLTRTGASLALGREAMGFGDVTLMAMVGAWVGWQPSLLACFLAVFIGLAHGIAQMVFRREAELPFGPSLCLATTLVVVGWRSLWEQAGPFFEYPLDMAAVVVSVIALTGVTLWAWHWFRGFSRA